MRQLRYSVAVSLDGFIAGPSGESDWITMDTAIDFEEFFKEFDTIIMGRRTFDFTQSGGGGPMLGMQTVVCSRTLQASDYPDITIASDAAKAVSELKAKSGLDLWLFGGGELFRSLLDARLVDRVELGVMPVLLSAGVPLLPPGKRSPSLRLIQSKALPSGVVALTYSVEYDTR